MLTGLFTAIVLTLIWLAFAARVYIVETTISLLMDRKVTIDNVVDIELGRLSGVTLQGVHMGRSGPRFQAESAAIETMPIETRPIETLSAETLPIEALSIGSISIQIDISDWLFANKINLTQLVLSNADLQIKSANQANAASGNPVIPLQFSVNNVTISYADEDQHWRAHVVSCTGNRHSNSSNANLNCTGELDNESFRVVGTYGLPDELGTKEPLDIKADWGNFALTAKGKLDSLLNLEGATLDLTLASNDAYPLLNLLGAHKVKDRKITVNARIENHPGNDSSEFNIDGFVAGLNVQMQGTTQNLQTLDSVAASFRIKGPSLQDAGAIFNDLRLAPKPFLASGQFLLNGPRLEIPELNLELQQGTLTISATLPELPSTKDLQLRVEGKQFKPNFLETITASCDLTTEPLDLIAEIKPLGDIQKVFIETTNSTLQLNATGTIEVSSGDINLQASAQGTTMAALGHCLDIRLPDLPVSAAANLTWKGNAITLREIHIDSTVIGINGQADINLSPEITFSTTLGAKVPNARRLINGLLENPGAVRAFPFESSLSIDGSENRLRLKHFKFNAGEHTGHASGIIGEMSTLQGLDLELTFNGTDLQYLFEDAQRKTQEVLPYSLSTRLKNQRGTWLIDELDATVAGSTVSFSARITDAPQYVGSALQLRADGKNIENLIGHWAAYPLPPLPYAIAVDAEFAKEHVHFKNLDATVGEHQLTGNLFVDKPPNYSKTSGNIVLNGPSINELVGFFGIEHAFLERSYLGSFELEGNLKALVMRDLAITIGESDLTGQGTLQNTQPPTFELDLKSRALYLPLFAPGLLAEETTDAPASNEASIFSSTVLPAGWLNMGEGNLKYKADSVWTSADYTTSFDMELALLAGELKTNGFKWDGANSAGQLDLTVNRTQEQLSIGLDVTSSRLPIMWLFSGETVLSDDTFFQANFDSQGASVKSLVGNLNGAIMFKGGPGRIAGRSLDILFGDFLQTVSRKLSPRQTERTTNVACSGGGVMFQNGLGTLKPGLVMRTTKVDLFANGTVDLKTETADLRLMTTPRTGIGISPASVLAPRLTVKGSLANPNFSVDSRSSALSTYTAFISGGASVVARGLWDRVTRNSDPCDNLYKLAIGTLRPDQAPPK